MNLATSNYLPGDPRLIDQIVYELKSQGIFDQFRKECIADVDTKPAYQNLSQRVEGSVMNFLKLQTFSEDINKNQLREQLRKNISESGFLETGVERIVDQVVNPKINTVFLPKVEDVVYRFLGIEKPNQEVKQDVKVEDLLPTDLEAISPESVQDHSLNSAAEKKEESIETNDNSLNSSNTKTEEDESPPFELLEENTKFSVHEENSIDSHLSGISGLASHESSHSTEMKDNINSLNVTDVTQNSLNSEGNLSVILPEEDIKMEISEDSNILESIETKLENNITIENNGITENKTNDTEAKENEDAKEQTIEKIESISNENYSVVDQKTVDKKEIVDKKNEEKKISDSRSNSKRSHDKHKSSRGDKDRKDDPGKRSRSKSESKSKDSKSSSKHSSSSKDKEKRDSRNGKDRVEVPEKDKQIKKEEKERDRSKDKNSKIKEKDRDKSEKDKVGKDKEKSDKERSHKDKERSEKSRSEKEKGKSEKDKEKVDKDKLDKEKSEKEKSSSSKHNKERSSSSSKKDNSSKDKDRDKSSSNKDKISSSSKHKESTTKDKDSSKSSKDKPKSSSSNSRDKDKEKKDSKSRSTDKHKRSDKDKSSHHDKNSSRKDKEKKSVDDHYSLKDKKSERRSTDRDSNDGSSKMSRNGSFTETSSQSFKGSSKESSEVFSSGSGDTSNSDKVEDNSTEPVLAVGNVNAVMQVELEAPIKYFKPKFASNIHEAMKIMKIRKQLAKLERQNQLALVHVQTLSQGESNKKQNSKEPLVGLGKSLQIPDKPEEKQGERLNIIEIVPPVSKTITESGTVNEVTIPLAKMEESPMLKSQDLSMESFEALEARLAQEMSNVNYNMYGEEDDNYEYGSINFSPVKKQKIQHEPKNNLKKILFGTSEVYTENNGEIELTVPKKSTEDVDLTKTEVEKSRLEIQEHNEVSTKLMVTVEPNKDVGCGTEPLTVEPKKDVGCGAEPPDSKGNLEHVNNVQEFREDHEILSEPLKEVIKDVLTHNELMHKDEESSNKNENSISLCENPEEKTHNELEHKDEGSSNKKENSISLYENPEEKTHELKHKDEESSNKKENSIILYENPEEKTDNELEHKDEESSNKKENSISLYENPEEKTHELKHKDEESSNKKENSIILYENPEEKTHNELEHKDEESSNKKENSISLYENPEEKTHNELEHKDEESSNKKENSISLYENPEEKTHNELKHKDEESFNKKENSISLYDNPEEFRGFNEVDRDCSRAIKFTQMIFEMKKNIGKKINGKTNAQIDISKTTNTGSPRKRGISLGTTIKEVKNMSSTLQDLLQKNGKKLLIKVDHIESKLPSKTLVSFQDLEAHNVNKINIGIRDRTKKNEIEKKCMTEPKLEKKKTLSTKEINQNIPVDEKTDGIVTLTASNKNGIIEQNSSSQKGVVNWENDDSPCYYFDKPNSDSEKRIQILNDRIKSLEKAVQVQSLQIQNNIPKVAKRGRKRKAQSTENNNSISSPEKQESKKRHLAEANPIDGNLCNTDVTPDQNFSLPLSPADSEKSEEQKKEEAITVKPKRSGRVSNSKRYSSDDLYKPRPILSCSSTRRRGTKPEENKH